MTKSGAAYHPGGSEAGRDDSPKVLALASAARLAPPDSRFGYVYAVALYDMGRKAAAVRELERVPADPGLLNARTHGGN